MLSLISFIIVISISVISHEGGHFIAAKLCGVYVHEFSFGMGPSVLSCKPYQTLFSFRLFPVGGYVKMEGEDGLTKGNDDTEHSSLNSKSPLQKLFVVVAGPFVNIVIALFLTALFLYFNGVYDLKSTVIGDIVKESPAAVLELRNGDRIVSVNGNKVYEWKDISVELNREKAISDFIIEVERNNVILNRSITIKPQNNRYMLGIRPGKIKLDALDSFTNAFSYLCSMTAAIIKGFYELVTGKAEGDVVGPVGIAVIAGDSMRQGFWSFITFLAIINLHLGLINLFPFPALDGGRAVFILFELLTGRKLAEKHETIIHYIGFMLLISLMIIVTFKDLIKIISGR